MRPKNFIVIIIIIIIIIIKRFDAKHNGFETNWSV